MSIILHIAHRDQWQAAQAKGTHRTESLDTEGFIHCSTAAQVIRVANKFYSGQQGLLLLCIESDKVRAEVRFEPPINPQTRQPEPDVKENFPHIYGELNTDAVVKVIDFPPGADGTFTLPDGIPMV